MDRLARCLGGLFLLAAGGAPLVEAAQPQVTSEAAAAVDAELEARIARDLGEAHSNYRRAIAQDGKEVHVEAGDAAVQRLCGALLTEYRRAQRFFIPAPRRPHVLRARAALETLLASLQEPPSTLPRLKLAETLTLLGEDEKSRGGPGRGRTHFAGAEEQLRLAIDQDVTDPYAHYALGMALWNQERFAAAARAFADALALGHGQPDPRGTVQTAWYRLALAHGRALRFETACTVMENYLRRYARADTLAFDRERKRADLALAAREFEEAEDALQAASALPSAANWPPTVAQGGLVRILTGRLESGLDLLRVAAYEREHDLSRDSGVREWVDELQWLWLLGGDADAHQCLTELLETNRIGSSWDRSAVRLLLVAPEDSEALEERTRAMLDETTRERERRIANQQPTDALECEAWLRIAMVRERATAGGEPSVLEAYRHALGARPEEFSFEWELARLGFARHAASSSTVLRPEPEDHWVVHRVGASRPSVVDTESVALAPGDLVLRLRASDGETRVDVAPLTSIR